MNQSNGLPHKTTANRDMPGGSAGDPRMLAVKMPQTLDELRYTFERRFGYDVVHIGFFRRFMTGRTVADLGCGYGFSTFYVSDVCSRITGYDIDTEAIRSAKALKEKFGLTNVDFVCHQPYKANAPIGFYDVVVSSDVIEHVHRPDLYLADANTMSAMGGLLLLSTPNGLTSHGDSSIVRRHSLFHIAEYTPLELKKMLQHAGFAIEGIYKQRRAMAERRTSTRSTRLAVSGALMDALTSIYLKYAYSKHVGPVAIHLKHVYSRIMDSVLLGRRGKALRDWVIEQADLNGITASNCDAIVLVCRKVR